MPPLYDFIIVIPVADRPRMLGNCIRSLTDHLNRHPYGQSSFEHISLLIVDDSADPDSLNMHRRLAGLVSSQGLSTDYFGLEEQGTLLDGLNAEHRSALGRIIGLFEPGTLPGPTYRPGPGWRSGIPRRQRSAESAGG